MEMYGKDIRVEIIPPTKISVRNPDRTENGKKLRVAAYCRVSTGDEQQQSSYTQQKEYYTWLIGTNKDWEFAGIYADEGISGTSTKNRTQFNRIMKDALDGRIDRIITKSISRFARNTVDTLRWVQKLRTLPSPVMICFEKENLNSFDLSSDFILSVMSAFAQAESRSISDNVRWSIQKNFASGKPTINLDRMLGFDKGENGEWIINEKQAAIVREIYNMYICGVSARRIALFLNEKGSYTINGKNWTANTILTVLRNEKYAGDLTMQKSITVDMLTHTVRRNDGIARKYHIRDHHAPIIERDIWNRVQEMLGHTSFCQAREKAGRKQSALSNLYCAVCKKPYLRCHYSYKVNSLCSENEICCFGYPLLKCASNSKTDKTVPKLRQGEKRCRSEYLHECAVFQSFMEELYRIRSDLYANGNNAAIIKEYYRHCMTKAESASPLIYRDYNETEAEIGNVRGSIRELSRSRSELADILTEKDTLGYLLQEYELQLKELEKHKQHIFGKIIRADPGRKKFEYFIESIKALPEIDRSIIQENIQNVNDNINNTDSIKYYYPFDRALYMTFIESGVISGDIIEYKTIFGTKIITTGNSKKMEDFIGRIKSDSDGNAEIIKECYQLYNFRLQFRKRKNNANIM